MREIKFRAWDKAGDCWLQSALIQDFLSIGVPWTEKNEDGSFKLHQVSENRIEIMQYTGLKDKNHDKMDSRKSNLELLSVEEHQRYHNKGKVFTPEHRAKIGEGNRNRWRKLRPELYENPELLK